MDTDKAEEFKKSESLKLKCNMCENRFGKFSDLELHIKDKHGNNEGQNCHSLNSTSTQVESDKVISQTTTPPHTPVKLLRHFQTS